VPLYGNFPGCGGRRSKLTLPPGLIVDVVCPKTEKFCDFLLRLKTRKWTSSFL
jgi:hypothetical protein